MTQQDAQQPDEQLGWYMEGSVQEVADVLLEFAQQLRNGNVNVWKGQRELHLEPEGKLQMRVDASVQEDGREELNIRLYWTNTSASMNLHSGAEFGVPLGEQGSLGEQSAS